MKTIFCKGHKTY